MKNYTCYTFLLAFLVVGVSARTQIGFTELQLKEAAHDNDWSVYEDKEFDAFVVENYSEQNVRFTISEGKVTRYEFSLTLLVENEYDRYGVGGMILNPQREATSGQGSYFFGQNTDGKIIIQYDNGDDWETLKNTYDEGENYSGRTLKAVSDGNQIAFYIDSELYYKTGTVQYASMYTLIYVRKDTLMWVDDFGLFDFENNAVSLGQNYDPYGKGVYDLDWLTRPDYIPGGKGGGGGDPLFGSSPVTLGTQWKVTQVSGNTVTVSRKQGDNPSVGDKVKVYFVIEDIGIEAQKATGSISSVSSATFNVQIEPTSITGKIQADDLVGEL